MNFKINKKTNQLKVKTNVKAGECTIKFYDGHGKWVHSFGFIQNCPQLVDGLRDWRPPA